MFIKTISTKYNRKFNLGNYESVEIEVGMWADLDEDENPETATAALREMCRMQVRDEILSLKSKKKKETASSSPQPPSSSPTYRTAEIIKELGYDDD